MRLFAELLRYDGKAFIEFLSTTRDMGTAHIVNTRRIARLKHGTNRFGKVEGSGEPSTPDTKTIAEAGTKACHVAAALDQRLTEPMPKEANASDSAVVRGDRRPKSHRPFRHPPDFAHLSASSERHADQHGREEDLS